MRLDHLLHDIREQLDACLFCKKGKPAMIMVWLDQKQALEQLHPRTHMPARFYGVCTACMTKMPPVAAAEKAAQLLGDEAGRIIS